MSKYFLYNLKRIRHTVLRSFGCIGILLLGNILPAQTVLSWQQLEEAVVFKKKSKEKGKFHFQRAEFSEYLQSLEGQRVKINGYMLPITVDQEDYVLSRYSFAECYFCTPSASRASVIEIKLEADGQKFSLHNTIFFSGILKLHHDPYGLCFSLENAEPVDGDE